MDEPAGCCVMRGSVEEMEMREEREMKEAGEGRRYILPKEENKAMPTYVI